MGLRIYLPVLNTGDWRPNAPQLWARQVKIEGHHLSVTNDDFTAGKFNDVYTHTLFLAPAFWTFLDGFSHGY